MKRLFVLMTAAVVSAGTACIPAGAAPASETIEIPGGEHKLKAILYRPDGAGPFPAVVALHGCEIGRAHV